MAAELPLINIDKLIRLPKLQMRAEGISEEHVADLTEAVKRGEVLPPVQVRDVKDKGFLVTDGAHTIEAYVAAGKKLVPCKIRKGTWAQAVLDACAANKHSKAGLKRTASDKRRAVTSFFEVVNEAKADDWSDTRIAEYLAVRRPIVSEIRQTFNLSEKQVDDETNKKRTGTDGKKRKKPRQAPKKAASKPAATEPSANGDQPHENNGTAEVTEAQVDAAGIPIQDHALEAFSTLPAFHRLIQTISAAQGLFNQLANQEGGKFLTLPGISIYRRNKESGDRFIHPGLETALHQVKDAMPTFTDCPFKYADGGEKKHNKNCPTCKGLNWTPVLSSVPPVCLDRMKAALMPKDDEANDNPKQSGKEKE